MKPHPHLPLRALLQQAQTEEAIWLPDVLTMPVPRRWAWLSWLLLGWVPWLMVALELTPVLGLGGVLVLGLLGWVLCTCWGWRRWVVGSSAVAQEDMPLEWDGWRVQFAQRAVWRQGAALPLATASSCAADAGACRSVERGGCWRGLPETAPSPTSGGWSCATKAVARWRICAP